MEEHAALLSMLTGPTSSLVILVIMLYGAWKMTTQTLLPKMSSWVDKHLSQVDDLLAQHTADREAWLVSMAECSKQQQEMQGTLQRVEREVGGIRTQLNTLSQDRAASGRG